MTKIHAENQMAAMNRKYIYNTCMGDRQGRLSAVNLCPFVGVDLNL